MFTPNLYSNIHGYFMQRDEYFLCQFYHIFGEFYKTAQYDFLTTTFILKYNHFSNCVPNFSRVLFSEIKLCKSCVNMRLLSGWSPHYID